MAYRRITAAEAAEMIKDRDTLALSGFTPNGNPKAIFRELSKRAIRLHEQGEEFGIGILTGASSCQKGSALPCSVLNKQGLPYSYQPWRGGV